MVVMMVFGDVQQEGGKVDNDGESCLGLVLSESLVVFLVDENCEGKEMSDQDGLFVEVWLLFVFMNDRYDKQGEQCSFDVGYFFGLWLLVFQDIVVGCGGVDGVQVEVDGDICVNNFVDGEVG